MFFTPYTMPEVYTNAELTADTVRREHIRLGVIGNPIAHSKSPQMQQAALDAHGIPARYIRILADTAAGAFEETLRHLDELGFTGANVTVPFKKNAFAAAAKADALSTLCGAANTLVRKEDGWHCHNTDGPGFERAIFELTHKKLHELNILILGACGGAGSALAAQCALAGCPQLTLVNRPRPQLQELADTLAPHAKGSIVTAHFGSGELADMLRQTQLIVNATSLGLKVGDSLPIPPELLTPQHIVYDIVPHDTPFRRLATEQGCLTDNGLGMLLWQGAYAFEHWYGFLPQIAPMRAALCR